MTIIERSRLKLLIRSYAPDWYVARSTAEGVTLTDDMPTVCPSHYATDALRIVTIFLGYVMPPTSNLRSL